MRRDADRTGCKGERRITAKLDDPVLDNGMLSINGWDAKGLESVVVTLMPCVLEDRKASPLLSSQDPAVFFCSDILIL